MLISLERLSNLTELFPFTVFIIDEHGNFLEINDVDSQLLGYSRKDILKLNFIDLFPVHQKHTGFEILDQVAKTGTFSGEALLEIHYTCHQYYLDIIKVSKNLYFVSCKQKDSIQPSSDGEKYFKAIFENTVMAIAIVTIEGKLVKVNSSFEKILGIKFDPGKSLSIKDILPVIDQEKTLNQYKSLAMGLYKSIQTEQDYITATGELINARITRSLIKDIDGHPQYIMCMAENITELRKTEAALRLSQFSLEHLNFATFWIGIDGIIYNVNKATSDLLGYSKAELINKSMYKIDPDYPINGKNKINSEKGWGKLKQQKIIRYETLFIRKDGSKLPVEVVSRYLDFEGKEYNFAYAVDISDRKISEVEMFEYKLNQDILLKSKTSSLQQIVTELETQNLNFREIIKEKNISLDTLIKNLSQLTGIGFKNINNLLQDENSTSSSYIETIATNIHILKECINNILDIFKLQAGLMDLDINPFTPEMLVENVVNKIKSELRCKNIHLNISLSPIDKVINADLNKCEDILSDLLSYSIRVSPVNDQINLDVINESANTVKFSISYSPSKMQENEISVDKDGDKKSLNLTELAGQSVMELSKKLIILQEGLMGIDRGTNNSATIWFSFPLTEEMSKDDDGLTFKQLNLPPQKKILIAEDNDLNLKLLVDILEIHHQEIIIARDGQEAIEKAKETNPDLILMDVKMPVMCGIEATKILKSLPEFKNIPIVALTASAGLKAKELHIGSGFDDHLEKPYTLNDLFDVLNKFLCTV